jgi:hypothetical protein
VEEGCRGGERWEADAGLKTTYGRTILLSVELKVASSKGSSCFKTTKAGER